MPSIFFVNHPDKEPRYGRSRVGSQMIIPWNTTVTHRRKMIERSGVYLNIGALNNPLKSDILFWGEYEVGSNCTIINTLQSPKAVHNFLPPVSSVAVIPPSGHNTDPYVFGDIFKYTCCRIGSINLKKGDVVVFGTYRNNNTGIATLFAIDTFFVVEDEKKINCISSNSQFYLAAIVPNTKKRNTYFEARMWSPNAPYFSFVPCMPCNNSTAPKIALGFKKPIIDLGHWGRSVKHSYYGYNVIKCNYNYPSDWNYILTQINSAGLHLGIFVDSI